ncbi:hypothetical protein R1sor_004040 [Riccia sorocarpa]|uniref:F-box domain-containing protein n=1 Tax=Riccia sorocarpa TaxID=122646 RepID=A0ABD3H434_9MARC
MDSEVWKHVGDHEEILRLVLARVSWDTNLRLRPVSKAWNETLSEPSFLTWSSMLTDQSFYVDHPDLEWVDTSSSTDRTTSDVDSSTGKKRELRLEDPICLLSISQTSCAVANFELHRWCKLPLLEHPPLGEGGDWTISSAAGGLLLLERSVFKRNVDLYNADRFLLNPVSKCCVKLPPVPKVLKSFDRMFNVLQQPMMMVDKDKSVIVMAFEFSHLPRNLNLGLYAYLNRVLIWRQNASIWEVLETDETRTATIREARNAVFADGELFIHTKYLQSGLPGHRVIRCEKRAEGQTEILVGDFDSEPVVRVFQHRGTLKRLTATWKGENDTSPLHQQRKQQNVKLCSFNHLDSSWEQESMIEMPKDMVKKLYDSLPDRGIWRFCVDVEGDILCIGNRFKAQVFFLYNLLTNEWTEVRCLYFLTTKPSLFKHSHESAFPIEQKGKSPAEWY